MVDIYDDKPFLHDLMNYTTETVIGRCLAVLEIGVFPFIGDPSAGMSLISPDVYQEHVLPYHPLTTLAISIIKPPFARSHLPPRPKAPDSGWGDEIFAAAIARSQRMSVQKNRYRR